MNDEPTTITVKSRVEVVGPLLRQRIALALWEKLHAKLSVAPYLDDPASMLRGAPTEWCDPLEEGERKLYDTLTAHFSSLASFSYATMEEIPPA